MLLWRDLSCDTGSSRSLLLAVLLPEFELLFPCLELTLFICSVAGGLLEERRLSVDNEGKELACELVFSGRVQSIADIHHAFPL